MIKKVKVSVVIPTYNRKELLRKCLPYLFNQNFPKDSYEIIIVDDGSKDGTCEMIEYMKKTAKCKLSCIRQKNSFIATARNNGTKHAKGDIVVFTDDDVNVDKNWVKEIASSFTEDSILGVEGKTISSGKITPFTHQVINEKGGSFDGCNMAFRKSILLEFGGYDTSYPMHNEDLDFAAKVLENGKIKFNPNMIVIHPPYEMTFKSRMRRIKVHWADFKFYRKYPAFFERQKGGSVYKVLFLNFMFKQPLRVFYNFRNYFLNNPLQIIKFIYIILLERIYLIFSLSKSKIEGKY